VTATATDAALGRLFNAADAAYRAWQQARVWRKREAWERYVAAETAYWRAFNGKENDDQFGRTATKGR